MATSIKRLRKEAQQLQANEDEYIFLSPKGEDVFTWRGLLKAPPDSVYNGFTFVLDISIPQNYPLVPPTIYFRTKIFHPNVLFSTGEICLDILKKV
jgi:ubiquitin-protein ligase